VLDTRQYRSNQQQSVSFIEALGEAVQVRDDALTLAPDHVMLGDVQRNWVIDGAEASAANWDVIAQQVFMYGGNAVVGAEPPVVVVDTWDGYAGERKLLLEAVGVATDNLVVLTGDFHPAAVADLRSDPFDYVLPLIGAEFMGTSISSSFFDDDETVGGLVAGALEANPQIKIFDAQRGHTLCEVTPDRRRSTYRAVEDQFDETSAVQTISTWEIAAGTPVVVEVT
jgi:alkaline phosphatase D